MYQTRDGYLWVGTGAGLARFDGIRFATFESAAVPEVVARPIFGFMEDAEGFLWIGHSRGASRYRNGRFERAFGDELMEGRRVWAFAQAKDGAVWAATENGLGAMVAGTARRPVALLWTVVATVAFSAYATVDRDQLGGDLETVIRTSAGVLVGLGLAWLVGRHAIRRVGGITGDVLGPVSEVATTGCLVVLASGVWGS